MEVDAEIIKFMFVSSVKWNNGLEGVSKQEPCLSQLVLFIKGSFFSLNSMFVMLLSR